MSYQTRRSGNQPQQPAANVGQRRPVVTNNFVAGQNPPAQQQQPQQQRPPQAQQAQRPQQSGQQATSQVQFRQQQQPAKPQTPAQQQYNQQQQAQRVAQPQRQPQTPQAKPAPQQPQGYQTQFVKAEPGTPGRQNAPVVPGANPPPPDTTNNGDVEMDTDETKKKKPWMRGGKISKKEKLRRRNLNLSKILQPKNAVMILNELVKNTHYTVEELACKVDNNQYKAVVTFEGEDHAGLGRSKTQAKNNAAENALKYLIKNKQLKLKSEPTTSDDPMDGGEATEPVAEDASGVLPWQHVASFALFKLFSSWGEDPMAPMRQAQELLGIASGPAKAAATPGAGPAMKPAKQLPANPELLNPIMLLNQMRPGIQFTEVGQSGTAPNVTFTYQVTVDEQSFTGTANNKKNAKKNAAFSACYNVFDVKYPADVWSPLA